MKKQKAVLLIHGFAGGKNELSYLYDHLNSRGFHVFMPTIYGHGSTKKELAQSNSSQWVNGIRDEFLRLSEIYEDIVLIGFSMGGLIATNIMPHESVLKMVFINTPVYFWNFPVIISDIFEGIFRKKAFKLKRYANSVGKSPISACLQFFKLLLKTRNLFKNINKPLLILQCSKDETVYKRSAKFIYAKTKSFSKMIIYNGGRHVVFEDTSLRDKICNDVEIFIT